MTLLKDGMIQNLENMRNGPCEPHEVLQGQAQVAVAAPGFNLWDQSRLEGEGIESSPREKDLRVLMSGSWT